MPELSPMHDDFPRSAPNYTQACVVMFGVNLSWILFAIWTIWGLLIAMLFSWALNRGLEWLDRYRQMHRAASIRRGKS